MKNIVTEFQEKIKKVEEEDSTENLFITFVNTATNYQQKKKKKKKL